MSKKIVIPGGTGQIGTMLAEHFVSKGHEVIVLGRSPKELPWGYMIWDGKTLGDWADAIDGADVVINLAGRSVNCRYTEENRRAIMDSRVDSTRVLGLAIAAAKQPPSVWLQSSTATIYSHRYDVANDEASGTINEDGPGYDPSWKHSVEVARAWERTLDEAEVSASVRKVALRAAMVMSPHREGIFDVMSGLARRGLGGTAGDGRQYVSWIHWVDFIAAIEWIIDRDHLSGPINLAAPNPLPNRDFMKHLRAAWGTGIGLPATAWMLKIGAVFMQTEAELLLKSRRVVPGVLLEDGFSFTWPGWEEAAAQLARASRAGAQ